MEFKGLSYGSEGDGGKAGGDIAHRRSVVENID